MKILEIELSGKVGVVERKILEERNKRLEYANLEKAEPICRHYSVRFPIEDINTGRQSMFHSPTSKSLKYAYEIAMNVMDKMNVRRLSDGVTLYLREEYQSPCVNTD